MRRQFYRGGFVLERYVGVEELIDPDGERECRPVQAMVFGTFEPDCIGKWTCSHNASVSAMARMTPSLKSLGCGLVKRSRLPIAASSAMIPA